MFMFNGFLRGPLAFFIFITISIGTVLGLVRAFRVSVQQRKMERTVADFIVSNGLENCEPGFYDRKEKLLAVQLGISVNAAYAMLSIIRNKQLHNVSAATAAKSFRTIMLSSGLNQMQIRRRTEHL